MVEEICLSEVEEPSRAIYKPIEGKISQIILESPRRSLLVKVVVSRS
jgi:hypothetical protein